MDGIGRWPICLVPYRPAAAILDGVASLVDKSLVRQSEQVDGDPRYGMLQTIREYRLEQLAARGEAAAVRDAHAAHFLAMAHVAEAAADGLEGPRWMGWYALEHANLGEALAWLEASGQIEAALCLAYKLGFCWEQRGYLGEIQDWLERLLARGGDNVAPGVRAKALVETGALALGQADFVRVGELCAPALTLARQIGDRLGAAEALSQLGIAHARQGHYRRAEAHLAEALALRRAVGDLSATAGMLMELGILASYQGDVERAHACFAEILALPAKAWACARGPRSASGWWPATAGTSPRPPPSAATGWRISAPPGLSGGSSSLSSAWGASPCGRAIRPERQQPIGRRSPCSGRRWRGWPRPRR
jgi:tetratricopeptide (TPR) repeat protein